MPVLDDDGFILFESRAIIRYLDTRLPGLSLTPRSPRAAARMNQRLSVDQSYIAPYTRALAVERILRKHEGIAPNLEIERTAEQALAHAFGVVDRALGVSEYLAGDAFSLADISLLPYVASLPMLHAGHLLTGLSCLGTWWARVSERPSWKRAIAPL